jgi:hypothetical protein
MSEASCTMSTGTKRPADEAATVLAETNRQDALEMKKDWYTWRCGMVRTQEEATELNNIAANANAHHRSMADLKSPRKKQRTYFKVLVQNKRKGNGPDVLYYRARKGSDKMTYVAVSKDKSEEQALLGIPAELLRVDPPLLDRIGVYLVDECEKPSLNDDSEKSAVVDGSVGGGLNATQKRICVGEPEGTGPAKKAKPSKSKRAATKAQIAAQAKVAAQAAAKEVFQSCAAALSTAINDRDIVSLLYNPISGCDWDPDVELSDTQCKSAHAAAYLLFAVYNLKAGDPTVTWESCYKTANDLLPYSASSHALSRWRKQFDRSGRIAVNMFGKHERISLGHNEDFQRLLRQYCSSNQQTLSVESVAKWINSTLLYTRVEDDDPALPEVVPYMFTDEMLEDYGYTREKGISKATAHKYLDVAGCVVAKHKKGLSPLHMRGCTSGTVK